MRKAHLKANQESSPKFPVPVPRCRRAEGVKDGCTTWDLARCVGRCWEAGQQDGNKPRWLTAALRPWLPLANLTDSTSLEPHLHHQPWPWSYPVPPGSLSTHPCAYTRGSQVEPHYALLRSAMLFHPVEARPASSQGPGPSVICLQASPGSQAFSSFSTTASSSPPLGL